MYTTNILQYQNPQACLPGYGVVGGATVTAAPMSSFVDVESSLMNRTCPASKCALPAKCSPDMSKLPPPQHMMSNNTNTLQGISALYPEFRTVAKLLGVQPQARLGNLLFHFWATPIYSELAQAGFESWGSVPQADLALDTLPRNAQPSAPRGSALDKSITKAPVHVLLLMAPAGVAKVVTSQEQALAAMPAARVVMLLWAAIRREARARLMQRGVPEEGEMIMFLANTLGDALQDAATNLEVAEVEPPKGGAQAVAPEATKRANQPNPTNPADAALTASLLPPPLQVSAVHINESVEALVEHIDFHNHTAAIMLDETRRLCGATFDAFDALGLDEVVDLYKEMIGSIRAADLKLSKADWNAQRNALTILETQARSQVARLKTSVEEVLGSADKYMGVVKDRFVSG
ncbi:hypothetical protein HXX76_014070 [Chlamydomonas incerta]|uniref:Uncharacterized protein n=1 Tax=Chlamydomonas incerta TaxID=51695 RepID=A0A835SCT1_CHLIN|nr:hypothetical protein HXX76_014070 [Chlamydomonas incerta]|eukprot:KAG2424912.1 hypothetical protein HXX76_014070 [Chlamydomonas incerta]